jgi:hypothetical protein
MSELFLPAAPSTEGHAHWYVVCAKDEQKANLVGPFFSIEGAQEEVRLVDRDLAAGVDGTCNLPHFITPGPMPDNVEHVFGVKRPLLYDDPDGFVWWNRWAYAPGGELHERRMAAVTRMKEPVAWPT